MHRYPDRVLFLVTGTCPVYCRYCTRSRIVGSQDGEYEFSTTQWERAIDYIARTPVIRDVLLSGGDPLLLSDDRLEWVLSRLRQIPHVEFLRIGTKVPAVLPQRITPALTRMLRRYHPLWMSLHFIHPDELTPEVEQACGRLADAGIPLGSQTPLLLGVNDSVDVCRRLFHGLLRCRVKPYYLYQADLVVGTSHFRTPVSKALEIIEGLRGHTTRLRGARPSPSTSRAAAERSRPARLADPARRRRSAAQQLRRPGVPLSRSAAVTGAHRVHLRPSRRLPARRGTAKKTPPSSMRPRRSTPSRPR